MSYVRLCLNPLSHVTEAHKGLCGHELRGSHLWTHPQQVGLSGHGQRSTVNVDIFVCIHFHVFEKTWRKNNPSWIFLEITCLYWPLGFSWI